MAAMTSKRRPTRHLRIVLNLFIGICLLRVIVLLGNPNFGATPVSPAYQEGFSNGRDYGRGSRNNGEICDPIGGRQHIAGLFPPEYKLGSDEYGDWSVGFEEGYSDGYFK